MLIEITEDQHRQMNTLIANANIRGVEAPAILQLSQAINNPVTGLYEKKKKKKNAEG